MAPKLTSEEALATLEAAAIQGKPVTAAQLAEAREAVRLDELREIGKAERAAVAEAAAADEARAAAKATAVEILADLADLDDAVEAAEAAVTAAVEVLVAAVSARNDRVRRVRELFDTVAMPSLDGADPDRDEVDPDYHVHHFNTNAFQRFAVNVAGQSHALLDARSRVEAAVEAGRRAGGMRPQSLAAQAKARRGR